MVHAPRGGSTAPPKTAGSHYSIPTTCAKTPRREVRRRRFGGGGVVVNVVGSSGGNNRSRGGGRRRRGALASNASRARFVGRRIRRDAAVAGFLDSGCRDVRDIVAANDLAPGATRPRCSIAAPSGSVPRGGRRSEVHRHGGGGGVGSGGYIAGGRGIIGAGRFCRRRRRQRRGMRRRRALASRTP